MDSLLNCLVKLMVEYSLVSQGLLEVGEIPDNFVK
jgi:hypothetical protein